MLTDKCKEDFEKWAFNNGYCHISDSHGLSYDYSESWYDMDLSMTYGVYVNFFDSVGINIFVKWVNNYDNINYYEVWIKGFGWQSTHFIERHEARKKAIEKANQLYNSK